MIQQPSSVVGGLTESQSPAIWHRGSQWCGGFASALAWALVACVAPVSASSAAASVIALSPLVPALVHQPIVAAPPTPARVAGAPRADASAPARADASAPARADAPAPARAAMTRAALFERAGYELITQLRRAHQGELRPAQLRAQRRAIEAELASALAGTGGQVRAGERAREELMVSRLNQAIIRCQEWEFFGPDPRPEWGWDPRAAIDEAAVRDVLEGMVLHGES